MPRLRCQHWLHGYLHDGRLLLGVPHERDSGPSQQTHRGRRIVEQEQSGASRAAYGRRLLDELSAYLTKRCGRGWSVANLKDARQFYQVYSPSIRQPLISESEKGQTALARFALSWTHLQ